MVTGAEITLGIQALKTAIGIAKEAKDLTDASAIRGKVIEMQSLIMEAQASAIDAREAHAAQVHRIRELEEEMARLKAWDAEKQRYELKNMGHGAFVYALKPDVSGGEPPHWLCANCFSNGKKSYLGVIGYAPPHPYSEFWWTCPACKSQVRIGDQISPEKPPKPA